jgi:diacylglycerol kinase (ATP)
MKRKITIAYYFLELHVLQLKISKYIQGYLQPFVYAITGVKMFLMQERNAKIHTAATIIVLSLGCFLSINKMEWIVLLFCISFVFITEMLNTAIEKTLDFYTIKHEPRIAFIKDVAAGAVLIAALTSTIIGAIIFIPKIYNYAF